MAKNWTQEELETCMNMIGKKEPVDAIAKAVNRSENAVIQKRRRFIYDDMNNNMPLCDLEKKYHMTKEELDTEYDLEVKSYNEKKERRKQIRKNNAVQKESNGVPQNTATNQNIQPPVTKPKQKDTYTLLQKMEIYKFICGFDQTAKLSSYRDKLYYNIMKDIDSYLR